MSHAENTATSFEKLQDTFQKMSKKAQQDGAALEVSVGKADSFSASYQLRKLKKYSADQAQSAVFRVLVGRGTGLSTTENLTPDALEQAYQEALKSARDLNRSIPAEQLAPQLFEGKSKPQSLAGTYHSDYSEIPTADKLNWAQELEASALDFDARITNVPYSGISHSAGERFLFNSKGLALRSKSSSLSGYSYALAKQAEDSKMAAATFFARAPMGFRPKDLGTLAAQKSLSLLGATTPKTGRWNVVFQNEVAAELVGLMADHFSAKSLDEGTSLLKDKKGEVVFSKKLSWRDDPLRAELPAARAFDAEGAPSAAWSMVNQGKIENYLTNSYYARKMNLPHTAHAVRGAGELDISSTNLIVEKGNISFEQMMKIAPDILYVTEITALHSGYKDSTGDFSLPATGYLYRHGEVVGPVHQFVISGNILQLLGAVTEISDRWNDNGDSTLSPDLFVPDLSVAGQT